MRSCCFTTRILLRWIVLNVALVSCGPIKGQHVNNNLISISRYLQYRPLIWRNTHPYLLIDRHEDVTDPNLIDGDADCDRIVVFYGYVRGTHLKPSTRVHLVGVGDFGMADISALQDPCPIPEKERERTVSL